VKALAGFILSLSAAAASATVMTAPPATRPTVLNEVTIEQRLGQKLPLDLTFLDEAGRQVTLGSYFGSKPVLIVPVYYECPMLCNVTLNQLNRTLNALTESAGNEFDIVTVSFDPREQPPLAAAKKKNYLRSYARPSAETGWHFLTGQPSSIEPLMKAIGFQYEWDEKNKQFAHAAAVVVANPDGTISRYFLGVDYPPVDLRTALNIAGAGQVGAAQPAVFLYCFKYDPNTGKYGLIINRALKVSAGVTVIALLGLFFTLNHVRHRHERVQQAAEEGGNA
jgi:protein SCO1